MLIKPIKSTDPRLLVKLITVDVALGRRLAAALAATGHFHVETMAGHLAELAAQPQRTGVASLLVLEVGAGSLDDLTALETLLRAAPTPPATIILADGLGEAGARRLLKLQIADWLSTS